MGSFPPRERFEAAVAEGNALLTRYGYPQRGTAEELSAWLHTDTPYPNPDPADLLGVPFLVVHEIVEIDETKRRGLRITQDVIVRNMEIINDAHLTAAEIELRIAAAERKLPYVASRFADLESWCEDPLLTEDQKARYESFRERVSGWLRKSAEEVTEEL
ncbi:MAG TPA: hypothetical protein HA326_09820 [Thermoplasmata archaeon]|nr:hypothetical protein [Thermoplasmata archaeon]